MDVFSRLHARIGECLNAVFKPELLSNALPDFAVELPKNPEHGDISTNAAMVLAPRLKQNPRILAQKIVNELHAFIDAESISVAGSGFINFTFKPGFWQAVVLDVLAKGSEYGKGNTGGAMPVNVEYVSANPTGPMHIGHARGAVVGDVLANILEMSGYKVSREYYINDAGGQINALVASVHIRYLEALGGVEGSAVIGIDTGEIPYPGEYLKPLGRMLFEKYGDALRELNPDSTAILRDFTIEQMMNMIRDDLSALNVKHDVFFSENSLHMNDKINSSIEQLIKSGHVYQGVLEPPKGMHVDDYETREQTLFRSTAFGDDVDRAIKKSDGSYTYFAADIAYHYDKYTRGFARMIDVWGADHGGYVKRMKAAVRAITEDKAALEILLVQLVNLTKNGQMVKMSKRSGDFVSLREVADEVGSDAVRFMMLTRKADAPLDFDLEKVKEKSADNPVFYVQYAHARACSVLRNAKEQGFDPAMMSTSSSGSLADFIKHPRELQIIKILALWPKVLAAAAQHLEPHRIAFYLQDLAAEFHGFWNVGKEDVDLRFIIMENSALTSARLLLVRAVKTVLANGLTVLGVSPVEEMR